MFFRGFALRSYLFSFVHPLPCLSSVPSAARGLPSKGSLRSGNVCDFFIAAVL